MIFGINRLELHHKKAGCDMDKLEEYQRWQNNLARVRFPRWKELPTLGLYVDQVVAIAASSAEDTASRTGIPSASSGSTRAAQA